MTAAGTIGLRPAAPRDADRLSELAVRSKGHWGYDADFLDACRDELAVSVADIANSSIDYVVAADNEEVLGYYALEALGAGNYELDALFVEPRRIGHGIGRQLMQHALAAVADKGGGTVIIQGDPNAAGFYRAAGGRPAGQRESGSIPGRWLPLFEIVVEVRR